MNAFLRWACLSLLGILPAVLQAQININAFNTPVTYDFNALPNGPALQEDIVPGVAYVNPFASYGGVDNGTAPTTGTYAFDDGTGNYSLGGRYDVLGGGLNLYGVRYRNNTGEVINCLTFTIEQVEWSDAGTSNLVSRHNCQYRVNNTFTTIAGGGYTDFNALDLTKNTNLLPFCSGNSAITPIRRIRTGQLTGLNLLPGQELMIRWRVNARGGTPPCQNQHALGIDNITVTANLPLQPTGVQTTVSSGCNPFDVIASWNQVAGAASYDYEVWNDPTFSSTPLQAGNTPTTIINLAPLASGSYFLRVRAVDACGTSPWTVHPFNLANVTGLVAGAAPNPACVNVATTLSANLPPNATFTSFQWQQSNAMAGPFAPIVGATTVPFSYTPAAAGTEYIRLRYQVGTCPPQETAPFALTITAAPAPATVTVTPIAGCPPTRLQIGYTPVTAPVPTSYTAQVATDAAFSNIIYTNTSNLNPRNTPPTPALTPGTYHVRVRANFAAPNCANSDWTVTQITIPATFTPGSVFANPATLCTGSSSELVLAGSNGLVQWQQESACNSGVWANIPGGTTYTFPLGTFPVAGNYCYRAVVTMGTCLAAILPSPTTRIQITVKAPPTANAGTNQTICGNTATLAAAPLLPGETGSWDILQGTGTFVDFQQPNTSIFGLDFTQPNILRWTVNNGVCPTASANVTINARNNPSPAVITTTPSPLSTCNNTLTLTAVAPTVGTGTWTMTASAGPVTINQVGSNLNITNLTVPGNYTFRWRIINPPCPLTQAFITVTREVSANAGVASAVNPSVCVGNSATLQNPTATGTLQWQRRATAPCAGAWVNIPAASANTYVTPPLTPGDFNCYRLRASAGTCPDQFSNVVNLTINNTSFGGNTAPAVQSVCGNTNTGTITLTGQIGTILGWERSPDNVTWTPVVPAVTTPTLTFTNLTADTYFRAVVESAGCPTAYSTPALVQVVPAPVGGDIGTNQTLCAGQSYTFNLTAFSGNVKRWEFSNDGFITVAGTVANTTPTLTTPNLTATVSYRAVVGAVGCPDVYSNVVTLTVVPAGGGTVTPALSQYCGSSATRVLTAAGFSGTILRWESSTDCANFTAPTVIPVTTPSYTVPPGLTQTTCFRMVTDVASCPNSTVAELRVSPNSVGGTLAGAPTAPVCAPTAPVTFTLTGQTGNIVRWERSIDNQATWQNIGNAGNNTLVVSGLTVTTSYRVRVQSGTCPAVYSTVQTITVSPSPVAGTIVHSNPPTVCSGSNGFLTLVGFSGNIVRWETSTDNFATFTIVPNTTSGIFYTLINTTTSYRAVVETPGCPPVTSAPYTVNVTQPTVAGTISSTASTVCSGLNSGTLTLTGNVGNVLRWESSVNANFNTITTLNNTTTTQPFSNLTVTTYYRALVQNGSCVARYTNPFEVFVVPPAQGGTISGTPVVCGTTNTATLVLSNFSGQIVRWESSNNSNFAPANTISFTGSTLVQNNITGTTFYRAVVGGSGCTEVFSNTFALTHSAGSVGGTANASPPAVCSNASAMLMLTGSVGQVVRWEASALNCNGPWQTLPNSVSPVISSNPLTQATCFRAVVQNGVCPTAFSTPTLVAVADNIVTRVDVTNVSCANSTDGRIEIVHTASNAEFSVDGGNQFFPTPVFTNLPAGTYTVVVRNLLNPSCPTIIPNVQITQPAQPLTIVSIQPITLNCSSPTGGAIDLTVSGGVGPYRFAWSNGSQSEDLANVPAGNYSVTVTDANGCRVNGSTTLNPGSNITVDALVTNARCNGSSTGSIALTVNNGLPPYTFTWSNALPNSSTVTGLAAGTYTVTIRDAANCTAFRSYTVTQPLPLVINVSTTPTTCPTAGVGTAMANPFGGTAPYAYAWSTGGTTSMISALPAGTYTVTVTDANACQAVATATVGASQPAPAAPIASANPASLCSGGTTLLSVVPMANMAYNWFDAPTGGNFLGSGNTLAQVPLATTTYYVAATDNLNPTCVSQRTAVTVTVTSPTVAGTTSGSATVCSGTNSGTINLTGNTGNILRWEASNDNFATVSQTLNVTSSSISYLNLTQTTSYRAVVQNGNCPPANSTVSTVTVNASSCGSIVVSPSSITFGNIVAACDQNPRVYTVSGTSLTSPIEILAPANFEVALDAFGPYVNSLTLVPVNGNVAQTTIYIRVMATAAPGTYSGNVSHTSGNVTPVNFGVSATVQAPAATVYTANPNPLNLGSSPLNTPSAAQPYTLTIQNPTAGFVFLSVPPPFELALTPTGPFATSQVISVPSCQTLTTTVYVRFTPTVAGVVSGNVGHTNNLATFSLPVSGTGTTTQGPPAGPVVRTNPNYNPTNVPPGTTFGVDAFDNLQDAVNAAPPGGRVILDGPTHFGDNVIIRRPITIEGSGPGQTTVRPVGNRRNTYPTGNPAQALDPAFQNNHAFIIQSDDVTIKDLTISGDPTRDCPDRFGVGIISDNRTGVPYNNLRVENVNIEYVYSKGIQFFNAGEKHSIKNVRVDDVCLRFDPSPAIYPTAAGIYVNDPAEIENNIITRAGSGIWVEGDFGRTAGISTILGNQITDMEWAGIRADLGPNIGGNRARIAGNTISNVGFFGMDLRGIDEDVLVGGPTRADQNIININTRPNRGPGVGLRVSNASGPLIRNLQINAAGLESGIWVMNTPNLSRPVRITEADIRRIGAFAVNPPDGRSNGIFQSDRGDYIDAPNQFFPSGLHIWNSQISGFNVGVFTNENAQRDVEVLVGGTAVQQPSVTIFNNDIGMKINGRSQGTVGRNRRTIRDNRIGIYIFGGELQMEGSRVASNQTGILSEDKLLNNVLFESIVNITNSLFEGNGINIDNRSVRPVQASFNFWGTNNANLVNASMRQTASGIDFSPWFNSNIDVDPAREGFDGDYSFVHIDPRSFQIGGLSHLQEAVNEGRVQRVFVNDGNYSGSTTVNRSLTLLNDGAAPNPMLGSLTMNGSGARLTMENSFEVSSLALNLGLVDVLGANTLQLNLGGSLTGGSDLSYVIGAFARQSNSIVPVDLLFPIGSALAYRPVTLNVGQQFSATNTYTGQVNEPNPFNRSLPQGVLSASPVRSWTFSQSGSAPVSGYQFTGAYGADDPGSSNPNDLVLLKDSGPQSSVWANLGGTATGSPNGSIRTTSSFGSLGNFVLGSRSSSGPVTGINLMQVINITTSSALPMWSSLNCTGVQYEVRYRVKGSSGPYTVVGTTSTFVLLSGLQHNTTYEVAVRGRCGSQPFTGWSTGVVTEFTTESLGDCNVAGTPPAPGNLHVNQITARTAVVNWRRATTNSTQGYIISFGDAALNPNNWPQFVVCNPATTFLISGLTPGRTYGVRIRTNCSNCTTALSSVDRRSNWTPIENFTTLISREGQLSTSEETQLSVYPNPTNGLFTLRVDGSVAEAADLTLTDLTGRVVLSRTLQFEAGRNEIQLSLDEAAAGIYLLRVRSATIDRTVKVVRD